MPNRPVPIAVLAWAGVIGLVQGLDVGVHVAAGQLEPLRVAANVMIAVWAVVAVVQSGGARGLAVRGALGMATARAVAPSSR